MKCAVPDVAIWNKIKAARGAVMSCIFATMLGVPLLSFAQLIKEQLVHDYIEPIIREDGVFEYPLKLTVWEKPGDGLNNLPEGGNPYTGEIIYLDAALYETVQ